MNLQNIPKRDKLVKKGFIPKLDSFLFFDYDQIEMRLLAFYMNSVGDSSMVEAFAAGIDIHVETAKAMFHTESPTEEEREAAKTFNYAIAYGSGDERAAFTLTTLLNKVIDTEQARALRALVMNKWPGIKLLHNPNWIWKKETPGALQLVLAERGYLLTLYGRHLHPEHSYQALNYVIQGTAADIMKDGIVKAHSWLKEEELTSHIVNVVHDELILDTVSTEHELLVNTVPVLMKNRTVNDIIEVGVSVEISQSNWAEKEPY